MAESSDELREAVIRLALGFGPDVRVQPTEDGVLLVRNRAFASIKPATLTRIHLGFALGLRPAQGRLRDCGGFAKRDRITHRIAIRKIEEIDAEVERWLRLAYDEDAL